MNTNLSKANAVSKLLKKLSGNSTKIARGSSCMRCRQLKRRCDGSHPCGACIIAGADCTNMPVQSKCKAKKSECDVAVQSKAGGKQAEADDKDLLCNKRPLWNGPEPPITQQLVECPAPKSPALDPMCPSLGGMGMLLDLGWRDGEIADVFRSCPPRLCAALNQLSCVAQRMIAERARTRRPLPELIDLFESSRVGRVRLRMEPDGSKVFLFNSECTTHYGEPHDLARSALLSSPCSFGRCCSLLFAPY
eukprot:3931704-Rhodomonas_salina.1